LKLKQNPKVSLRASRHRFDSDGVPWKLLQIGSVFVQCREEERSFARLRWCSAMDRQVKARILIEPSRKLSQHKKSVGQKGKTKKTEDERCG